MQARFANSPQSVRPLARRRQGEFPLPEGQTSGCLLLFLINEKEIAPQQGCFCFGEAIHVGRLHSLANASPVRKFAAERPPACEAAARRISLARRANFRVLASLFNKRKRNRIPTDFIFLLIDLSRVFSTYSCQQAVTEICNRSQRPSRRVAKKRPHQRFYSLRFGLYLFVTV